MHHTAYINAEKFYHKYCEENIQSKKILDVGSYNVNGTMKPIFIKGQYVGLDIEEGPNVDVVGVSHDISFGNDVFDIIISSSCFEHDDMFWVSFQEMCRVLKPGGYIYINAPSTGPYHAHPGDSWRFYKDSWKSLEKWVRLNKFDVELVESYIDYNTPIGLDEGVVWNDSIGIYRKNHIKKIIDKEMKLLPDYGTDLEIQKYFEPGYSGVCIDIGAGVGTGRSNTYYFEKKYWRCLCIEPNPGLYNHMRMYRRLAMNLACSNYDKKEVPFQIYSANDGNQESISSLVVDQRLVDSHKGMINKVEEIKVEVKKLDTVLSRINLEKIDFVSIDTEGTELEVLMGFDINRWKPRLFIIENSFNESKFTDYLDDFGYKFSQRIGVNDFFVREEKKEQKEHNRNSPQVRNLDYIFEI